MELVELVKLVDLIKLVKAEYSQEQCSIGYLFQVRFGQKYRYGEQGTHGTVHGYVGAALGYVGKVLGTVPM